jgi:hypothetical protein
MDFRNLDNLAKLLKKVKGPYHKSRRKRANSWGKKVVSLSLLMGNPLRALLPPPLPKKEEKETVRSVCLCLAWTLQVIYGGKAIDNILYTRYHLYPSVR